MDPVGFRDTQPALFNRYAYVNNNPYKYVNPNGEYLELGIEAVSIGLGAKSLADNLAAGNYTSATVDGLGIVADFVGSLVPGVPGVIGIGLSVSRASSALTPAQAARISTIDNTIKNHAKPHDFTGVSKELAGKKTGYDYIQEMENSVGGLKNTLKNYEIA